MAQLRLRRSDLQQEIADVQAARPALSTPKLEELSRQMRARLIEGTPELRQAYMRLLLHRVEVNPDEIRLEGAKRAIERLSRGHPSAEP